MKTLVAFDGGANGAMLITGTAVLPLPPLKRDLLHALKATAKLVSSLATSSDRAMQGKLSKMAIGSANLAIEMAEGQFGALNPDRAIIFQDDDGGFTCGSTGKPPIPFPWPPRPIRDASDLVRKGVVEQPIVDLIRGAKAKGIELTKLFEDPVSTAKSLGVKLPARDAETLAQFAPSKLAAVKDPVDREVLALFHAVLKDGSHTDDWFDRPVEVATKLKVKLSEGAVERVLAIGGRGIGGMRDPSNASSAITAGVIWAGVCIAVGTLFVGQMNPLDTLIKDRSGVAKF
jgi:hypothetical protein